MLQSCEFSWILLNLFVMRLSFDSLNDQITTHSMQLSFPKITPWNLTNRYPKSPYLQPFRYIFLSAHHFWYLFVKFRRCIILPSWKKFILWTTTKKSALDKERSWPWFICRQGGQGWEGYFLYKNNRWAMFKTFVFFHYTGCVIGILISWLSTSLI